MSVTEMWRFLSHPETSNQKQKSYLGGLMTELSLQNIWNEKKKKQKMSLMCLKID